MKMKFKSGYPALFLTIAFSLILTLVLYSNVFFNLNKVYFGGGGDALQSYSNTLYHIKYDSTYMFQQNMNYPYGENVFYTNCQFPIANSLKFLKSVGVDLVDYTIGILNFAMLISITLSIIFLYLIFRHLELPEFYSALASIGIGFLSPQIHRFIGHFTLSYMFAIPFALYMLLLFYKYQEKKYSLLLGGFTFFISLFHIYYLGLIGAIILCFWVFLYVADSKFRNYKFILINSCIQLIIPFVVIKLWGASVDTINDRTENPWGYFTYTSFWEGVFLPLNTPLEKYYAKIFHIDNHEFEGIAYIGLAAVIGFGLIGLKMLAGMFKRGQVKNIFSVTDHPALNTFFWCAILTLIFSFGFPFNKFENLYHYIGFIKQMRGVGRFAWIFFYVINIVSFYLLYKLVQNYSLRVKYAVISFVMVLLLVDGYIQNKEFDNYQHYLNMEIPNLYDKENTLVENNWIQSVPLQKYQAIMPLPYFHVGSESIWYGFDNAIPHHVYIATVKTGLPTLGVHLSRTSLSQTYKSMALVYEPYRSLEIIKDFQDKRPFLVLADKNALKENEKKLFSKCKFLLDNGSFQLYELSFEALETISDSLGIKVKQEISLLNPGKDFYSQDSGFVYEGFNEANTRGRAYRGKGSLSGPGDKKFVVWEKNLPQLINDTCKLSFWFADINKDLYGRTIFTIELIKNGKVFYTDENSIFRYLQAIDHDWALFEREIPISEPNSTLRLSLSNDITGEENIFIDELLIRKSSANIYKLMDKEIYKNNRFYLIP